MTFMVGVLSLGWNSLYQLMLFGISQKINQSYNKNLSRIHFIKKLAAIALGRWSGAEIDTPADMWAMTADSPCKDVYLSNGLAAVSALSLGCIWGTFTAPCVNINSWCSYTFQKFMCLTSDNEATRQHGVDKRTVVVIRPESSVLAHGPPTMHWWPMTGCTLFKQPWSGTWAI